MIKIEETETYGDHPRVCGEQTIRKSAIKSQTGSSPRVRGAEGADVAEVLARGIIPACAGSSTFESNRVATLRDHPRVCGEQAVRMHAYRCLKFPLSKYPEHGVRKCVECGCYDARPGTVAGRAGFCPTCWTKRKAQAMREGRSERAAESEYQREKKKRRKRDE